MKKIAGIDYGTFRSTINSIDAAQQAKPHKTVDDEYTLMSTICKRKDETFVGKEADNFKLIEPENIIHQPKRALARIEADGKPPISNISEDGEEMDAIEASSILIRSLRESAEASMNDSIDAVLITHPACYKQVEIERTIEAAKKAGFTDVRTIEESVAAAYAAGLNTKPGTYLIADIGGGTSDFSIAVIDENGNITAKGTEGRADKAGTEFDEVIINKTTAEAENAGVSQEALTDPAIRQEIIEKARRAKHSLSKRKETEINIFIEGTKVAFTYTREQFEADSKPIMDEIMDLGKKACEGEMIDAVLLVGGSTKMPMMAERLKEISENIIQTEDPDLMVGMGAVLILAKMLQDEGEQVLTLDGEELPALPGEFVNSAAHSLGCKAYSATNNECQFAEIIPKGTPLPAKRDEVFALREEGQTVAEIVVLHGEPGQKSEDCQNIYTLRLTGLPVGKPNEARIKVEYAYNQSGLVDVTVTDLKSKMTEKGSVKHFLGQNEK